ncbi:hypothetical protein ACRE_064970 [Hapsidospora chrysogenum ATCC 11550]|uniref:Uncharacterized protein n=1 Tax=Hapsidospora chrysogenum (strain ATCC 11550 / CBS 779.69 / DSM 880 / IAM 14645 / JCM 23072 / IMI 49137) TaxID=857340 RepID=A0A086T091_HAPC1|nr:hypothetical protein ACRE_064970 [Hapsidospora chrysogenum ATCC 11550]
MASSAIAPIFRIVGGTASSAGGNDFVVASKQHVTIRRVRVCTSSALPTLVGSSCQSEQGLLADSLEYGLLREPSEKSSTGHAKPTVVTALCAVSEWTQPLLVWSTRSSPSAIHWPAHPPVFRVAIASSIIPDVWFGIAALQ